MRLVWAVALLAVPGQAESLVYKAEWRLMRAGTARILYDGVANGAQRKAQLSLVTEGLAGKLYRVDNRYETVFDGSFCTFSTEMNAQEGRKHRLTQVVFNARPGKAEFVERDLLKNEEVSRREIDVPPCVHDVIAGLGRLRTMPLEPGRTLTLPVSDGKKAVSARIDVQAEERIEVPLGTYSALRCEVFLFNNVLYRRKGRLFVWLTQDERRLPAQIKVDLPFYLGDVILKLESME
jgi:hypothetical protein